VGLAVLPASAVPSLNGAAMELVRAVRSVREEKAVRAVKAVKGQAIGSPGERPVHDPSSPAAMGQPTAPVVAASAAHLNGVVTASDLHSTVRLLPVFPAIAPAQTASPTSGDPAAALKVVPRAAVPTLVAQIAVVLRVGVALKGPVALMVALLADVLTRGAAQRLTGLLASR
jgi:hypothetical protein